MGGKVKRKLSVAAVLLIFALVVFLARGPILRAIGSFLVVQDELREADVIIVLGGGGKRVDEAVKIYKQGYSDRMIMTGGSRDGRGNPAGEMAHYASDHLGISADYIIIEPKAQSTYQHPIYVKPIMQELKFKSAIVVSSHFHMRRSRMLFDRAFKNSGMEMTYHPVMDDWFDMDLWWTDIHSRRIVMQEYMKLAVNVWGVRFSEFVWKLVGE